MNPLQKANELKKGCRTSECDCKNPKCQDSMWCGDRCLQLNGEPITYYYCKKCLAKAKANLEGLMLYDCGRGAIGDPKNCGTVNLCKDCQAAKEVYEGILA